MCDHPKNFLVLTPCVTNEGISLFRCTCLKIRFPNKKC